MRKITTSVKLNLSGEEKTILPDTLIETKFMGLSLVTGLKIEELFLVKENKYNCSYESLGYITGEDCIKLINNSKSI